jgi:hypothetical protein
MAAPAPDGGGSDGCAATPVGGAGSASPFRECLVNYMDDATPGDPDWGTQNVLSKRAVTFACGRLGVDAAAGAAHRHDPAELALCRQLGGLLPDVDVGMGDESDHRLVPLFACALLGDDGDEGAASTGGGIDEAVVRGRLFGGALDPRYPVKLRPFPLPPAALHSGEAVVDGGAAAMEAAWLSFRDGVLGIDDSYISSEAHWGPGGRGGQELAHWRRAYEWFVTHPALRHDSPGCAPVLVSVYEPRWTPPPSAPPPDTAPMEERRAYWASRSAGRPMGCVFPRVFAALTTAGSVVGVGAVVVHT